MINIRVDGLQQLQAELKDFSERRLKAAVATALTRTAVQARKEVEARLPQVFDRPTPYTLRQLRYVAATADRLVAAVGFNVAAVQDVAGRVVAYRDLGPGETPAGKYLTPHIEGGPRRAKRLEVALRAAGALPAGWFAVPGEGANVDAFGNMSRGQVVQILSQLRVQLVAGTSRNLGQDRRAIAAQRRAGGRFFVVAPGGKQQPGVYQRELVGRNVTPVVIFVRSATYRQRFDFNGMVGAVVDRELRPQLDRAIADAAARLAAKGSA